MGFPGWLAHGKYNVAHYWFEDPFGIVVARCDEFRVQPRENLYEQPVLMRCPLCVEKESS